MLTSCSNRFINCNITVTGTKANDTSDSWEGGVSAELARRVAISLWDLRPSKSLDFLTRPSFVAVIIDRFPVDDPPFMKLDFVPEYE